MLSIQMRVSLQTCTIFSLEERTVRVLPGELRASAGADAAGRWALPASGRSRHFASTVS